MVNDEKDVYLTFKLKKLRFDGEICEMLVMSNVTQSMKFERLCKDHEMLHILQASVSHNMRTPLNAITVCADMLLDIADLPPQCVSLLHPIRYASKILTCHVNDLLDFNLILKGEFKPTISRVITKDTVYSVVQIVNQ